MGRLRMWAIIKVLRGAVADHLRVAGEGADADYERRGDWRVTTTQAYKLLHALKDNGVTVKFVAFPVPVHSPSDPLRSRDVWRRWAAWLAQYLNEPTSTNRTTM
jgi:hypothetical protein